MATGSEKTIFTTNHQKEYFEDLLYAVKIRYGLEKTTRCSTVVACMLKEKKLSFGASPLHTEKVPAKPRLNFCRRHIRCTILLAENEEKQK